MAPTEQDLGIRSVRAALGPHPVSQTAPKTRSGRGVLVHEWLEKTGGAERVFDAMAAAFPDADMLCLWNDAGDRYPGRMVMETGLARGRLRGRKAAALPLMPMTWRRRAEGPYDWALVSSHLFAHHVSFRDAPEDFRKFVYVHSPARYLWCPDVDKRAANPAVRAAAATLRGLDKRRAGEAWALAANSAYVRDRIRRVWDRDARVLYPAVDVDRIMAVDDWAGCLEPADAHVLDALPAEFVLGASRFVPYKRLELVIQAGEAAYVPVVLAGGGPEEPALRARAAAATVPVFFVPRPSDELLYALYQAAVVYVFPAVEDFGIMPVEAMAAGARVVAGREGGVTESVVDGRTGALCDFTDAAAVRTAVRTAAGLKVEDSRVRAAQFGTREFVAEIRGWVCTGTLESTAPQSTPSNVVSMIPGRRWPADIERNGTEW